MVEGFLLTRLYLGPYVIENILVLFAREVNKAVYVELYGERSTVIIKIFVWSRTM